MEVFNSMYFAGASWSSYNKIQKYYTRHAKKYCVSLVILRKRVSISYISLKGLYGGGGGDTPIQCLDRYVPPNGVAILELLISNRESF